jgi:hypothetical protein
MGQDRTNRFFARPNGTNTPTINAFAAPWKQKNGEMQVEIAILLQKDVTSRAVPRCAQSHVLDINNSHFSETILMVCISIVPI